MCPDCPTVARDVSGAGTAAAEQRGPLTSPPSHALRCAECCPLGTDRALSATGCVCRTRSWPRSSSRPTGARLFSSSSEGVARVWAGAADQLGQRPADVPPALLRAGGGWGCWSPCAASARNHRPRVQACRVHPHHFYEFLLELADYATSSQLPPNQFAWCLLGCRKAAKKKSGKATAAQEVSQLNAEQRAALRAALAEYE